MTAPQRLQAVAGWDVYRVRGAVTGLGLVAERLPGWRARLEGVARTLDSGEHWAGPAALTAAAAVRELATVTWAVERALAESHTAFERLGAEAGSAQQLAREALAGADEVPGGLGAALDERGRLAVAVEALVPGTELTPAASAAVAAAEGALRHAAAASRASADAGAALSGVGVRDAFAPPDFAGLASRVPVADPVCVTSGPSGPPDAVALWWAALPMTTQLAALRADPAGLGSRDGLPAWARDLANRQLLAAALDDRAIPPAPAATARAVARRIEEEEAAGRQVQLQLFDLDGDRVVLGLGDLDTADAVAVLVPGIQNTPADDLGALLGDARDVGRAARLAAPGTTVATAVWLGYDSPTDLGRILTRRNAVEGGHELADSLAGLAAGRAAVAAADGRATVLAHSYGTVVVDEAADVPGRLDADAVVLLGSPGMQGDATDLEAPEVYDAAAPGDLVVLSQWFGRWTGSAAFGSTELPVDPDAGHSDYYDRRGPTLPAVGEVVVGVRGPG
ncbi:alpha/beta hydrolase [Blastococcus litoris]|uniref:alpha/beta hydrolase n=1 Tax=Blastococcus litoris TaxID=2171622 RepID=UPI000E303AA7|nr:alpha/beta hydrolase [Blastococcus litoris]